MTDQHLRHLHQLLTAFDATSLGEGDPIAGANTLAAMACSIANISRPGSGLVAESGKRFETGTSLLASGPLSSSLITDRVTIGLGRRQNNFLSHLSKIARDHQEATQKPWPKSLSKLPPGPSPDAAELALSALLEPVNPTFETPSKLWTMILQEHSRPRFRELAEQPLAFLTANKPKDLEEQLQHCHLGRPFAHLGVGDPAGFMQFKELGPAIMEGRARSGPMSENIRGTLLVADPSSVLGDSIRDGGRSASWLNHLLWLVDGGAGPEAPDFSNTASSARLDKIDRRYEIAMDRALGDRLNFNSSEPVTYSVDFGPSQACWIAFLKEMEPQSPGIIVAARNFFATLVFGLRGIVGASRTPKDFKYTIPGIEALARFLVHRVANARSAILYSAEEAWKQRIKERLLRRLSIGLQSPREIYRPLGLASALCEDLLMELESDGLVRSVGRMWERVEGARLTEAPRSGLPLEV